MTISQARALLDALDLWDEELDALHDNNPELAEAIEELSAIVKLGE